MTGRLDRGAARDVIRKIVKDILEEGETDFREHLDALEACVQECPPPSIDRDELTRIVMRWLALTPRDERGAIQVTPLILDILALLRPCSPPTVDRDALTELIEEWTRNEDFDAYGALADRILALLRPVPPAVAGGVTLTAEEARRVLDWHYDRRQFEYPDAEDHALARRLGAVR